MELKSAKGLDQLLYSILGDTCRVHYDGAEMVIAFDLTEDGLVDIAFHYDPIGVMGENCISLKLASVEFRSEYERLGKVFPW